MSDETLQEIIARKMEAMFMEAMTGGPPHKQPQTALRVRGNGFEVVEIDDDGKIIEPLRCNCGPVIHWRSDCPFAAIVT